jgi:hypothetical protein
MAETTSPDGGADTLAPPPITQTQETEAKQTIILDQPPADDTAIRAFSFRASDEALTDLKQRIAATRWPSRELVDDASQRRAARDNPEARRLLAE